MDDVNEEAQLDEQLTMLVDLFPDVDIEVLLSAIVHSEGCQEQAIDYVLAHQTAITSTATEDEAGMLDQLRDDGDDDSYFNDIISKQEVSSESLAAVHELHRLHPELDRNYLCSFVLAHEGEALSQLKGRLEFNLKWQLRRRGGRRKTMIPIDPRDLANAKEGTRDGHHSTTPSASREHAIAGLRGEIIRLLEEDLGFDPGGSDEMTGQRRQGEGKEEEEGEGESPAQLRDQAQVLHDRRVELLKKAASAYSTNKGGPIAQYYSMEAAKMGRLIEELNKSASYHAFVQCNRDLPSNVVDLHGLTVTQGLLVVDYIIDYQRHMSASLSSESDLPVKIIVGRGHHSPGGARLRPAINDRLRSAQVSYSHDGEAVFTLYRTTKKNK